MSEIFLRLAVTDLADLDVREGGVVEEPMISYYQV
jgi:hypothetical protein